jgi:hypothetical protein
MAFETSFPTNSLEFTMTNTRRNDIIRTVAAITGDLAVGVTLASVATWVIETAALGVFLSFLVWLIYAVAALALSQFVIHPAVTALASDRKLDLGIKVLATVANEATLIGRVLLARLRPA